MFNMDIFLYLKKITNIVMIANAEEARCHKTTC